MNAKKVKCPFFKEDCIMDNCAAYTMKARVGEWVYDKKFGDLVAPLHEDSPYCSVLNVFLPQSKITQGGNIDGNKTTNSIDIQENTRSK